MFDEGEELFIKQFKDKELRKLINPSTIFRMRELDMSVPIRGKENYAELKRDAPVQVVPTHHIPCRYIRLSNMVSERNTGLSTARRPISPQCILLTTQELELDSNQLIKLPKPHYGLTDAGDYWEDTITSHLRNDLKLELSALDTRLFFKMLYAN